MTRPKVVLEREPANNLALVASVAGIEDIAYYVVWSGDDPMAILKMLREVLKEAEQELPKLQRPMG